MSPTELSDLHLPSAARTFCKLLDRLDTGTLTFTMPSGPVVHLVGTHPGPTADLTLRDWAVAEELLRTADVGLGECFRDGRVETTNLTSLLCFCAANERALAAYFYARPIAAAWLWLKHQWRANTRRQARRNNAAHYDLSNEFYALWLDSTMTYSSALFNTEDRHPQADTLSAAQTAKYARIIAELNPQPGAHLLEIGCGWGGFAEYAARSHGLKVTGITLSEAQLTYANARIVRANLQDSVKFALIDYRDVEGTFDHVVSIEMFEAVGERYWRTYFKTLQQRLRPGGRAVVQAITITGSAFRRYRRNSDFIREYIFPGGMLAPVERMMEDATKAGLHVSPPHRFGADYAQTLRIWHQRVIAVSHKIEALGFDRRFQRLWQFYLNYCEAGFRSGRTDVIQLTLARH